MRPGIYPIRLGFARGYVVQGEQSIMVDSGSPNQGQGFRRALEKLPVRPEDIGLVLITHGHWDHIGSARDIKEITGARLAAHQRDKDRLEESLKSLPPGVTAWTPPQWALPIEEQVVTLILPIELPADVDTPEEVTSDLVDQTRLYVDQEAVGQFDRWVYYPTPDEASGKNWLSIYIGLRCGANGYVERLARAGLDSAQVSLEAADPEIHDRIVGHPGAWRRTVRGIRNLKAAGIHTHTNTTINSLNRDNLLALVDFLADMEQPYLSMNMVIRTGDAVGRMEIGYDEIGELVLPLKERTNERGMRFVWYSPVPLCLFNPVAHGLGSQSCSAADGLLSVAPDGNVLPCSSFGQGVGNLLHEPFDEIWNRRAAWGYRELTPHSPMAPRLGPYL